MAATIINGQAITEKIREEVRTEVEQLKEKGINPRLNVLLVGDDPASVVYTRAKEKSCGAVGIDYTLKVLPGAADLEEVLAVIDAWNKDVGVHGVMIELPLPAGMDKQAVLEAVDPRKDVDGSHPINRGYILSDGEGLFPATPNSCIELMRRSGYAMAGKNAVIVGRGETVGKPLMFMLLKQNATVTVCHTKTIDLARHTKQADIVIAAAGRAKLINAAMLKPGAVVIDAGINAGVDGGICGDVDFDSAKEVAGAISPVPGGVGSLTTVLVLKNVLKAIKLQRLT